MTSEQQIFLSLKHFPARFSVQQTAWYLGFEPAAIPILIARRMLVPLGNPARNAMKHFHLAELEKLRGNLRWFDRAEDAVGHHWQSKNARCRDRHRRSPASADCARSAPPTRRRSDVDPSSSTHP